MNDNEPEVTVTRSEQSYKTTKEDGLLFHQSTKYPDTNDGWKAWAEEYTRPVFTHAAAIEQLEEILKLAQAVIDENRDISENNENQFTAYKFAETLKAKADAVLIDIKEFEDSDPNDSVRAIYYQTLAKALSLSETVGLLYTAMLERDVLLGRKMNKTKTHKKVPMDEQRQAVSKYRELLREPNAMKATKAGELIAKEYGVTRKTITTWAKNYQ